LQLGFDIRRISLFMQNASPYILLTAAKNEEDYIAEAIRSVLRQSLRPTAWFIVDDGSTDNTVSVVQQFASQHPFIRFRSSGAMGERSFGSKDRALNEIYRQAQQLKYDFVGIQDADIAPERFDYYEAILEKFHTNARLGIAGGYIYERSGNEWLCRRENSEDSVAGGIQMFRRAAFEQIGGYVPLHVGGEDWLAQLDAKMAGWEVLACPELHVLHYRSTSSAGGKLRGLFRSGLMDAAFGSDPMFELVKCGRRLPVKPYLLGTVMRLSGYIWWSLTERRTVIPAEKVAFLRKQQLAKLRTRVMRCWGERIHRVQNQNLPHVCSLPVFEIALSVILLSFCAVVLARLPRRLSRR
jgi:GT2 family glycosyltransferase